MKTILGLIAILLFGTSVAFSQEIELDQELEPAYDHYFYQYEDTEHSHESQDKHDFEFGEGAVYEFLSDPMACTKATSAQKAVVNEGNKGHDEFLQGCLDETNNSHWCKELTRPAPVSKPIFQCTYGSSQIHRLIHPDKSTWKHAYKAVHLIKELEAQGVRVVLIYNWWRPEPYNKNIGGAPGRHPFGTAVDVKFGSMTDMSKAHKLLCKWRSQGRLRALGHYGTQELHFGIADKVANTWGKGCNY